MVEQPPTYLDPAIRAYYDHAPEESRLEHGAFQLEELRTRELIVRHAPELPAVVLDVGGAAGAYAFWLAELGYEVRLFDAVPRLVEVARRRNENAARKLAKCSVADARALTETNESAAMVLLLGPLPLVKSAIGRPRSPTFGCAPRRRAHRRWNLAMGVCARWARARAAARPRVRPDRRA